MKQKRISLLFDAIRSPYDIANVIQIAVALACDIYTSGSCIDFNNPKITGKVKSWKATKYPCIIHFDTIYDAIKRLKNEGKKIIGTSPYATTNFYDVANIVKDDIVVAFGTETTGLAPTAMDMMDVVTKLPMENIGFLTLSIAASAVAYELDRQLRDAKMK